MAESKASHSRDIPDTLMLETRAGVALNALANWVDEDDDYIPFTFGSLATESPTLQHSRWDFGAHTGRFVSAFALARYMSGRQTGTDVESRLRSNLFDFFGQDGLSYRRDTEFTYRHANMHDQRSVLLGLTNWFMLTDDMDAKDAAVRLCHALDDIAIKDGTPYMNRSDFWYFPSIEYDDGWPSQETIEMGIAIDPAHTSGRLIGPLCQLYQLTGVDVALDLAEHFATHVVEYSGAFNDDHSFSDGTEFRQGHFHSRTTTVAGVARFAELTNNSAYLEWVRQVFEWVLDQGTSFGWFPGGLVENKAHQHETCTLTDIIEIGMILARNGYTQYWDVVDRFVRNHLVELQLLSVDAEDRTSSFPAENRVVQGSIGGFAGWAAANDFVCKHGREYDVFACCTAAGTRALFIVWQNIVSTSGDSVAVNFLLNRGTEWVDVDSYLPHEGRVDVSANQPTGELSVRLPAWVNPAAVTVRVDGNERSSRNWDGPYCQVGELAQGETASVRFPMADRETHETAWDTEHVVTWRGNTVTSISPSGTHHPLYNHRVIHDDTPMTNVEYNRSSGQIYR